MAGQEPSRTPDSPRPPLWWRAAALAARLHRHDTRKDDATPYVAHPVRVALWIRHEFGLDDDEAVAAALLHDVIEDTGADYDDVAESCGHAVADLVAALTKNMILPESEREADYDRRLATADRRARLIKLADVLDNLTDVQPGADPRRLADRCRRALALASPDEASFPPARRAAERLRAALTRRRL